MGMFGYMTDTETVEPLDTVDVESEGEGTQKGQSTLLFIDQSDSRSPKLNSFHTLIPSQKVTTSSPFFSTS